MPYRLRNGSSRAFRRDFSRQAQRVNDAAKIFRVLTDAAFSGRQIQQQGIRRTIREHGSAENIRRNRVDNERKRMQLSFQSARIQAVIARAVHAGEIRLSPRGNGYGQEIVEELAKYAGVPVWNGLTNESHPTQILADFLTIREHFGKLKGINFVYLGDARYNMGNSLMVGCAKMGMNFTAAAPKAYFPDQALIETCEKIAAETGATLRFCEDPMEATKNADVLYTDVWVSMGEPVEVWQERIDALSPYQVNQKLMDNAAENAVFMHCLPAFHDHKTTIGKEMGEKFNRDAMEVTDEVFEGPQSIVFDEAENRMHTIKAVMAATL